MRTLLSKRDFKRSERQVAWPATPGQLASRLCAHHSTGADGEQFDDSNPDQLAGIESCDGQQRAIRVLTHVARQRPWRTSIRSGALPAATGSENTSSYRAARRVGREIAGPVWLGAA